MAPCPRCRVQPTTPYSWCTTLLLTGVMTCRKRRNIKVITSSSGLFLFTYLLDVLCISSPASLSVGSGFTSLSGATTHVPMLPLGTMMVTTWCPSCLSIGTETISCPTRLWDMITLTCWTLVGINKQCPLTESYHSFFSIQHCLILSVCSQARGLCRSS